MTTTTSGIRSVDLRTHLDLITSGTRKAGAELPASITAAWAAVDQWADKARTAAVPPTDLLDRILDVAGEGKDPYKDTRTARDILAATAKPAALMDRLDQRVDTLRWNAITEHETDLMTTWRAVVTEANEALARGAELIRRDNLGDATTLPMLGGAAAAAWGAATEAGDRLMHLGRAYAAWCSLLRVRQSDQTRAPVWLAPLTAAQADAWTERAQEYRIPGGGDQPWAGPWWLARNGIRLDLADATQLATRVTALDNRTNARRRAAEEAREKFLRDGEQPADDRATVR